MIADFTKITKQRAMFHHISYRDLFDKEELMFNSD